MTNSAQWGRVGENPEFPNHMLNLFLCKSSGRKSFECLYCAWASRGPTFCSLRLFAKFVKCMPNLDLWTWKFEIKWKILSAYPVNQVSHVNNKSMPCKFCITPVKRSKKKEFGTNLWLSLFCCNFKLFEQHRSFWYHIQAHWAKLDGVGPVDNRPSPD